MANKIFKSRITKRRTTLETIVLLLVSFLRLDRPSYIIPGTLDLMVLELLILLPLGNVAFKDKLLLYDLFDRAI